jgi:DNA-binding PucR family transcriptional regulator
MGLLGRLSAADYLLETLVGRSTRVEARLKDKVLGPLADDDHGELAKTLQTFLRCRFDRTAASEALHVHRNTLAYRLGRIEEITGLDLRNPRDIAYVYVAIGSGVEEPAPQ